jgi:hypothetical protein
LLCKELHELYRVCRREAIDSNTVPHRNTIQPLTEDVEAAEKFSR